MLPLWLKYPEIPRYSIGWRMGVGEDYSQRFSEWWEALSSEVKQEYQTFYPEPVGWRGWYAEKDWDEAGEGEAVNLYDLDGF